MRRPEPMPREVAKERLRGLEPKDADGLMEDFLESDTVMDPYLSKAPAPKKKPSAGGLSKEGDAALQKGLERLYANRGKSAPRIGKAPDVSKFGSLENRLDQELEIAARTEGLNDSRRFGAPPEAKPKAKSDQPTKSRNVQSILQELESLDRE